MVVIGSEGQAAWMETQLHGDIGYKIENRSVSVLRVKKKLKKGCVGEQSDLNITYKHIEEPAKKKKLK